MSNTVGSKPDSMIEEIPSKVSAPNEDELTAQEFLIERIVRYVVADDGEDLYLVK